mgnify:CR=1 FL=1
MMDIAQHQSEHQTKITFSDVELSRQLFGEHNNHLQQIAMRDLLP